jgi:hypothetical protein
MPIYHFNVRDGSNIPDPDETELPNLQAPRVEAVKLAGRLLLDEPDTFWEGSDWHVEVTSDRGLMGYGGHTGGLQHHAPRHVRSGRARSGSFLCDARRSSEASPAKKVTKRLPTRIALAYFAPASCCSVKR